MLWCRKPARQEDAKAEQILAAAKDMFLELGYAEASMDLVAQRARISKTTLYTRFPSKEALFKACIAEECSRRGMRFVPEDLDELDLEAALGHIARRFLDLIWSPEAVRIHQIVNGEATRFPEVAQAFYQAGPEQGMAAVRAYFARAVARGLIDIGEDPDFVAKQFLAALDGGPRCAAVQLGVMPVPSAEERERFIERSVRLFVGGLRHA